MWNKSQLVIITPIFRKPNNMSHKSTTDLTTFQGLIQALQNFWSEQGCVIMQPLDMEVGAGTFHPATFIRAIGPEPWRAAYVQPSRRPSDGRYGEKSESPAALLSIPGVTQTLTR